MNLRKVRGAAALETLADISSQCSCSCFRCFLCATPLPVAQGTEFVIAKYQSTPKVYFHL